MKEIEYSFPLGKIAVLEGKLVPRHVFLQALDLSPKDAFLRLRDFFFLKRAFKEEGNFLRAIFEEEKNILKGICLSLLKDRQLKSFLENIDRPDSLPAFSKDITWDFLRDAAGFYKDLLNVLNFLRSKTYNLKEEFYDSPDRDMLTKALEKGDFFIIRENLRSFYFLAEGFIKSGEDYLLEFLPAKFILGFFEEEKKNLLGPQIVYWYYFAKVLDLEMNKFLLLGKFYGLDRNLLKKPIDLLYA